MSLSKAKPISNIGDIKAIVYDFEKAGDLLPKHNHDELSAHITIVARGRLKAYSHDWETIIELGQCVDFPVGQPHEFMALEDNTRIYNIIKNSQGVVNDSRPNNAESDITDVVDLQDMVPSVHYL